MANVYDIANELERAIRVLPEYQAAVAAKSAVEADSEAKELWEQFLQAQKKLQTMMQSGQAPSQEEQEELTALGQKIEENPVLKAYLEQQQRLSVYIADIEKIVYAPLRDLQ
ncbi:YlbF/YmcA family competence regulator [Streptococcus sp. H49]|uniref:YlbF/YmcA family competence regulator n=1 Tax=Streptococcus huangxiaojuni TaxID=3237239 RepID=UPI0034A597A1